MSHDDPDDTPTTPPVAEAPALALAQWLAESDDEAQEMEEVVRAYSNMSTECRVLLRAICREFTKNEMPPR